MTVTRSQWDFSTQRNFYKKVKYISKSVSVLWDLLFDNTERISGALGKEQCHTVSNSLHYVQHVSNCLARH